MAKKTTTDTMYSPVPVSKNHPIMERSLSVEGLKLFLAIDLTSDRIQDAEIGRIALISDIGGTFYAEISNRVPTNSKWLMNDREEYRQRVEIHELGADLYSLYMKKPYSKDAMAAIKRDLIRWIQKQMFAAEHIQRFKISSKNPVRIVIGPDCGGLEWSLFMKMMCRNGNLKSCPSFVSKHPLDVGSIELMYGFEPKACAQERMSRMFLGSISVESIVNDFQTYLSTVLETKVSRHRVIDSPIFRAHINQLRLNELQTLNHEMKMICAHEFSLVDKNARDDAITAYYSAAYFLRKAVPEVKNEQN